MPRRSSRLTLQRSRKMPPKLECSKCHKTFSLRVALRLHLARHKQRRREERSVQSQARARSEERADYDESAQSHKRSRSKARADSEESTDSEEEAYLQKRARSQKRAESAERVESEEDVEPDEETNHKKMAQSKRRARSVERSRSTKTVESRKRAQSVNRVLFTQESDESVESEEDNKFDEETKKRAQSEDRARSSKSAESQKRARSVDRAESEESVESAERAESDEGDKSFEETEPKKMALSKMRTRSVDRTHSLESVESVERVESEEGDKSDEAIELKEWAYSEGGFWFTEPPYPKERAEARPRFTLRAQSEERAHQCPECHRSFKLNMQLNAHLKKHAVNQGSKERLSEQTVSPCVVVLEQLAVQLCGRCGGVDDGCVQRCGHAACAACLREATRDGDALQSCPTCGKMPKAGAVLELRSPDGTTATVFSEPAAPEELELLSPDGSTPSGFSEPRAPAASEQPASPTTPQSRSSAEATEASKAAESSLRAEWTPVHVNELWCGHCQRACQPACLDDGHRLYGPAGPMRTAAQSLRASLVEIDSALRDVEAEARAVLADFGAERQRLQQELHRCAELAHSDASVARLLVLRSEARAAAAHPLLQRRNGPLGLRHIALAALRGEAAEAHRCAEAAGAGGTSRATQIDAASKATQTDDAVKTNTAAKGTQTDEAANSERVAKATETSEAAKDHEAAKASQTDNAAETDEAAKGVEPTRASETDKASKDDVAANVDDTAMICDHSAELDEAAMTRKGPEADGPVAEAACVAADDGEVDVEVLEIVRIVKPDGMAVGPNASLGETAARTRGLARSQAGRHDSLALPASADSPIHAPVIIRGSDGEPGEEDISFSVSETSGMDLDESSSSSESISSMATLLLAPTTSLGGAALMLPPPTRPPNARQARHVTRDRHAFRDEGFADAGASNHGADEPKGDLEARTGPEERGREAVVAVVGDVTVDADERRVDPLVVLPPEAVQAFWELLALRDRAALSGVNQAWRQLVADHWKNLDLDLTSQSVTELDKMAALRCASSLARTHGISLRSLTLRGDLSKSLKELLLRVSARELSGLCVNPPSEGPLMDTLELLDQSNPVAASGHDSAWSSLLLRLMGPRLESLQLSGAGPLQLAAVAAMPLLESLDLYYEDTLDHMRPPDEVSLPRTLKVLRLRGAASEALMRAVEGLPELRVLDAACESTSAVPWVDTPALPTSLEELAIAPTRRRQLLSIQDMPRLRALKLHEYSDRKVSFLRPLPACCRGLESLEVRFVNLGDLEPLVTAHAATLQDLTVGPAGPDDLTTAPRGLAAALPHWGPLAALRSLTLDRCGLPHCEVACEHEQDELRAALPGVAVTCRDLDKHEASPGSP